MSPGAGQNSGRAHAGRVRKARLFAVLGVLVLAGLPFMIAGSLLRRGLNMPRPGPQPGGLITGRVVDEAGVALADVSVECFVVREEPVPARASADTPPRPVAATTTDADGKFRCTVPPADGLYRIYVGGGDRVRIGVDHSLVGLATEAAAPVPLEFELAPGCTLEAHFARAGGAAVSGGVLSLKRRSAWYELSTAPLSLRRPFRGGTVTIDGLPPMTADVHVRFDSGAELTFQIELVPGTKVSRFTL